MKRPTNQVHPNGAVVTTPFASEMIALLGSGQVSSSVAFTKSEFRAIQKLYGFVPEKPNVKPPPPEAPRREDFASEWDFHKAERDHEAALKGLDNWTDPQAFMQAGADRNALRFAERDGLRLLAWLARFVPPGDDPLKMLVQLAADAGWDVEPSDAEWANEEADSSESEAADVVVPL